MQKSRAIVICGHGSKNESGVKAFLDLFSKIKNEYPDFDVQYGFIEYSLPSLEDTLTEIINTGIKKIIVVPTILFSGVHIKYDIPYILNEIRKKFKDINIKLAGYIGINRHLVSYANQNILKALQQSNIKDLKDTNLLLIGVGSSQIKANIDIASLTRQIWEETGVHYALYSFISKMTHPSIEKTLEILNNMSQRNIVILPFLLFPGSYLDKIYLKIENFKKATQKNLIIANTLENNDSILKAIQFRINEVLTGKKDYAIDIPEEIQPRISLHK